MQLGLTAYGPMPQGEFLLKLGLETRCERLLQNAAPAQKAAIVVRRGPARRSAPNGGFVQDARAAIERACPAASLRRHLSFRFSRSMVTPDKMRLCASEPRRIPRDAHGFFTRQGGVSSGIYASLNCGPGSSDDAANVVENRARVAEILGAKPAISSPSSRSTAPTAVIAEAPWERRQDAGGRRDRDRDTRPRHRRAHRRLRAGAVLRRGGAGDRRGACRLERRARLASSRRRSRPCASSARSLNASSR